MAFDQEIKIIIKSMFDSKGFKNATTQMKALAAAGRKYAGLRVFEGLKGLGRQAKEVALANKQLKKYNAVIGKTGKSLRYLTGEKAGKIIKGDDFKKLSERISTDQIGGKFDKIKKTVNKVKTPLQQVTSNFKDFGKESTAAFEAKKYQVFLDQNKRLKQFGFQVKEGGQVVNKFGKALNKTQRQELISPQTGADFETFNKQLYSSPKLLKKAGLGLKNFRGQFKMYFLSVMFFGMQIQRVFTQMARSTLESYMKISEGTTQAGQGLSMLQAAFTTLKYSVGEAIAEALLPFIPAILNIIMKIVDFVETHKKLVAMLIIGGAAFGAILFLIGQIGLGIGGVVTLLTKMAAAIGLATGPFLIFLALGIALIVVFVKAWREFPEVVTPLVKTAFEEIKTSLENVLESLKTVANTITGGEDGWVSMAAVAVWSVAAIAEGVVMLTDLINTLIRAYLILIDVTAMQRKVQLKGPFYLLSKQYKKDLANLKKDWKGLKTAGKKMFSGDELTNIVAGGPGDIYDKMMESKMGFSEKKIKEWFDKEGKEAGEFAGKGFTRGWENGFEEGMSIAPELIPSVTLTPYGSITNKLKEEAKQVSADTFPEWVDYGKSISTNIGDGLTQGLKETDITEDIESIFSDIFTFGEGITGESETPKMEFDVVPKVDTEASASVLGALQGMKDIIGPLGTDFETIKNVLGTEGGEDGTIPTISELSEVTKNAKIETEGLKDNFAILKEGMGKVGTFITDTFNGQINSSQQALLWDSRAAMSAAFAQERYNRAKQGATGA